MHLLRPSMSLLLPTPSTVLVPEQQTNDTAPHPGAHAPAAAWRRPATSVLKSYNAGNETK
jgi:hypothetical protein